MSPEEKGVCARVQGKFKPSFVDTRARYDNRILVSRFVTSLPEGNIIPADPGAARERRGEMIFVLPNFLQNQIVACAIKISAEGDLRVLRTDKLEISVIIRKVLYKST